ncbi:MAG TPA: hypothetical protein VMM77_07195 [Gemmatimonadaceae bacterium]|nr:hypothetical protein [Gemmatimonadaceae bacterium]
MRRLLLVGAILILAACMRPGLRTNGPAGDEWTESITEASVAAHQGRYRAADSLLAHFMSEHWGSWEAREAAYWRAVYMLDPLNPDAAPRNALPLLELYLADSSVVTHSQAARALRALAGRQDSLRLALLEATSMPDTLEAPSEPAATPSPREGELAREVARLKEQLDQTTAELERIKRRLTTPP